MRLALIALLCAAIAACGQGGPSGPGVAGKPAATPSGDATAEQVAEESRGDVDCPAKVRSRPDSTPVDDVLGVRPGQTFDEAVNVVLCTNDLLVASPPVTQGFNIETFGATIRQGFSARFAEPRVVKTSKQIMQEMQDDTIARGGNAVRPDMLPGQSRWYVTTMGMPGDERVIAAAREEWFGAGRNPTMRSVADALIKKYGPPTRQQVAPHVISLVWMRDSSGQYVPDTSPLSHQCTPLSSPTGGSNFSPDCGLVVAAMVWPLRDNPALSEHFEVGVADQANGYRRIVDTEQALENGEKARRKQQVDDAAKNADAPQL